MNRCLACLAAALMVGGCAAGITVRHFDPAVQTADRRIVLVGEESRLYVEDALEAAGWDVLSPALAAHMSDQIETDVSPDRRRIVTQSGTATPAQFMAEIRAQQTDQCIGLMGRSSGWTPYYGAFVLTIRRIATGDRLLAIEVSGCEEKAMNALKAALVGPAK